MSNSGIIFPGQPVLPVEKSGFGQKISRGNTAITGASFADILQKASRRSAFPITLCSDWKAGSWI